MGLRASANHPRPRHWPNIMVSHTSTQARCTVPAPGGACTKASIWMPKPSMSSSSPKPVGEFFTGRPFRHQRRSGRSEGVRRWRGHQRGHPFFRGLFARVQGVQHHPVRHVLIAAQRAYIAREASVDSFSEGAGIVAEGRDITTVVAPDAEVRILLTAREEVRQARRSGQAVSGVGAENVCGTRPRPIRKSPTSHPPRKAC